VHQREVVFDQRGALGHAQAQATHRNIDDDTFVLQAIAGETYDITDP
jgi:hypothetical protein